MGVIKWAFGSMTHFVGCVTGLVLVIALVAVTASTVMMSGISGGAHNFATSVPVQSPSKPLGPTGAKSATTPAADLGDGEDNLSGKTFGLRATQWVTVCVPTPLPDDTMRPSETVYPSDAIHPSMDDSAHYVAFYVENGAAKSNGRVYLYDTWTSKLKLLSKDYRYKSDSAAEGDSIRPFVSADGHCVVYGSSAKNIVPGIADRRWHVYMYNTQSEKTSLISVSRSGGVANGNSDAPTVSSDCRFVAFSSDATNLVDSTTVGDQIYVRDLQSNTTRLVTINSKGVIASKDYLWPSMSADGKYVVFLSKAGNLTADNEDGKAFEYARIYIVNVAYDVNPAQRVRLVPLPDDAQQFSLGIPAISGDGRYIAYGYEPGNPNDKLALENQIYLYDSKLNQTIRVSMDVSENIGYTSGYSNAYSPMLSANNRYLTFYTYFNYDAAGLSKSGIELTIYDILNASFQKIPMTAHVGTWVNSPYGAVITPDGLVVAYEYMEKIGDSIMGQPHICLQKLGSQ